MTREEIIRMAREAGFSVTWPETVPNFERFAALIAAAEREACAVWAELVAREMDDTNGTSTYIAKGIRARGQE